MTDENFVQAKGLWDVLGRTPGQQDNLVRNLSGHLKAAKPEVRAETISKKRALVEWDVGFAILRTEVFAKVSEDLAQRIAQGGILK